MATQKDVARLAGVSVSTVSRVLNGSGLVDEKTRSTVQSAIKKLNYKPNLLAYSLRARSSRMIGVILPEMQSIHSSFLQYVGESCMKRGYSVLVGMHCNECERERALIDEFQRRNVDGLILYPAIDEQNVSNDLLEYVTVPIVLYEHSFADNRLGNVSFNNYEAGVTAAKYLLSLGHRNVGCTVGPMGMKYIKDRFWGFHDGLKDMGIEIQKRNIYECDFNYQVSNIVSGEDAVRYFVDGRDRSEVPTAIWAHNDNVAIGIIKELHRRGIRIPQEMSVVGMDNISLTDMIYPPLTTIGQPVPKMAEKAVAMLVKEIESKGGYKAETIVMEPELVIRESAGPVMETFAV